MQLRLSRKLARALAIAIFTVGPGAMVTGWFRLPIAKICLPIGIVVCVLSTAVMAFLSQCPNCGSFSPFLSITLNKEFPCRSCGTAVRLRD